MADVTQEERERAAQHELPEPDAAREWLESMMLIRRFEERAGEMYAKAKVGGFLHLAIGEEATIVGAVRAMRDYGIVGGNLPLAAGMALSSDYRGTEEVTLCVFGDGASNQGTFGETLNLAALWDLPVVFMVTNNQFGMGTSLERHSAVTDLHRRGEGFGVPGMRCDGMDVLDTYAVITEALGKVREERQPVLVEAITYRFRGHSMADPEEYRTKEQVAEWRKRDPIQVFARRLEEEGILEEGEAENMDEAVVGVVDDAVRSADKSPFPPPESLYDDIYVLGDQVKGWYSVDERSAGVHRGEEERDLHERERGPEGAYHEAADQARREDVGLDKASDRAQAEDDGAEKAEPSERAAEYQG